MRWSRLYSKVVVFLFVSIVPAFAALPVTATFGTAPIAGLFNTREIFHADTGYFKQWTDMIGRANAEFAAGTASCPDGRPECAAMNEWSRFIAVLAPLPLREKVLRANAALNRVPYVPTARNWNRAMYWEAPLEFLSYGGQCQDYAIAKYVALRQAGVSADQMRIVVLRAAELGEDHAVLVVDVDGEALLLDNLRRDVAPVNSVASYRPYYSINETGWWQHFAPDTIQTAQR